MSDESTVNVKGAPDHTGGDKAVEAPAANLAEVLAKLPGAPGKDKIETWKQEHGEVMVSGFNEDELFIFRPLTRREYVTLQKKLRTQPEQGKEPMNDFDYEDDVVSTCLLWSSVGNLNNKGGTISTLSEQIMQNSNFTNPALAAALVMKL